MDITNELHTDHISNQFNQEIESLKTHFLGMGGLVEKQVRDAVDALMNSDSELAGSILKMDSKVNEMEKMIDEECGRIIARRQPTASDLRLVLGVAKAVSDLERAGDEAAKIARHSANLAREGSVPGGYREVRHIGNHVRQMLYDSLDSFARMDVELAMRVLQEEPVLDEEYNGALRQLMTVMMEDSRSITRVLDVIWALRALERIGDHSQNIAEFVIFMVKGKDLRHTSVEEIRAELGVS